MAEEPEGTEEDSAEIAALKTGAKAWKERRALISSRGADARKRTQDHEWAKNSGLTKKRPRG